MQGEQASFEMIALSAHIGPSGDLPMFDPDFGAHQNYPPAVRFVSLALAALVIVAIVAGSALQAI